METNNVVIDDVEVKAEKSPEELESMVGHFREQLFLYNLTMRRQSHAAAKQLKGMYLDFVFDKLNLTKHR